MEDFCCELSGYDWWCVVYNCWFVRVGWFCNKIVSNSKSKSDISWIYWVSVDWMGWVWVGIFWGLFEWL